jgi:hypothetical protein
MESINRIIPIITACIFRLNSGNRFLEVWQVIISDMAKDQYEICRECNKAYR